MFWFKKCPRCSGDLHEESDQYGSYVSCVQCGFCRDTTKKGKIVSPPDVGEMKTPKGRLPHGGREIAAFRSPQEGAT